MSVQFAETPDEAGEIAARWLDSFGTALQAQDAVAVAATFISDGHWRDVLAFTWDVVTHSGRTAIEAALEPVFRPIGFNKEIALALVPGMAAREVAVSALGTVYSLQGSEDDLAAPLIDKLRAAWSLPTALAFLAWYVFAPQCISTLAVTRRETNGWKWPAFMFGYLFAMAYAGAGITYWTARWLLS